MRRQRAIPPRWYSTPQVGGGCLSYLSRLGVRGSAPACECSAQTLGEVMAVQYDPNIIHAHAEALYAQARRIVFKYGFLGFIVGASAGGAVGAGASRGGAFALIGGLVGVLIGVSMGRSRAFVLQLQAQSALCSVAIEANTRRAADAAVAVSRPAEVAQLSQVG